MEATKSNWGPSLEKGLILPIAFVQCSWRSLLAQAELFIIVYQFPRPSSMTSRLSLRSGTSENHLKHYGQLLFLNVSPCPLTEHFVWHFCNGFVWGQPAWKCSQHLSAHEFNAASRIEIEICGKHLLQQSSTYWRKLKIHIRELQNCQDAKYVVPHSNSEPADLATSNKTKDPKPTWHDQLDQLATVKAFISISLFLATPACVLQSKGTHPTRCCLQHQSIFASDHPCIQLEAPALQSYFARWAQARPYVSQQ